MNWNSDYLTSGMTSVKLTTLLLGDPLISVAARSDSLTIVAGGMSGRVHFLRLENIE